MLEDNRLKIYKVKVGLYKINLFRHVYKTMWGKEIYIIRCLYKPMIFIKLLILSIFVPIIKLEILLVLLRTKNV